MYYRQFLQTEFTYRSPRFFWKNFVQHFGKIFAFCKFLDNFLSKFLFIEKNCQNFCAYFCNFVCALQFFALIFLFFFAPHNFFHFFFWYFLRYKFLSKICTNILHFFSCFFLRHANFSTFVFGIFCGASFCDIFKLIFCFFFAPN